MKNTIQKFSRFARLGLLALLILLQAPSLSGAYGYVVWHHHHNVGPRSAHGEPQVSDAHGVVVQAVHARPDQLMSEGHEHHAHAFGQAVPLISLRQSIGVRHLGANVWARAVAIGLDTAPEPLLSTGISQTLLIPEPAIWEFDPTRSPPVVA